MEVASDARVLGIPVTSRIRFDLTGPGLGAQRLMRRLFAGRVAREVEQDRQIWERKAFLPRPVVSAADGPIVALRTWLTQFYGAEVRAGRQVA